MPISAPRACCPSPMNICWQVKARRQKITSATATHIGSARGMCRRDTANVTSTQAGTSTGAVNSVRTMVWPKNRSAASGYRAIAFIATPPAPTPDMVIMMAPNATHNMSWPKSSTLSARAASTTIIAQLESDRPARTAPSRIEPSGRATKTTPPP